MQAAEYGITMAQRVGSDTHKSKPNVQTDISKICSNIMLMYFRIRALIEEVCVYHNL